MPVRRRAAAVAVELGWLKRVVVVAVAVALTLAVAELVLRIAEPRRARTVAELERRLEESRLADPGRRRGRVSLFGLVQGSLLPEVIYELKPALTGRFRGRLVHTNLAGLREDRDYPLHKPPGVYRIVGLGDSVMFGWGVAQGENYLDVLEARLGERQGERRFEVINCAVPGYNTSMEVASLEHKCLAYEPDLVIIHFVNNDLRMPLFLPLDELRPPPALRLMRLATSALGAEDATERPRLFRPWIRGTHTAEKRAALEERYEHMRGEQAYRLAMARLVEITDKRSIPVWLALTGTKGPARLAATVAGELGLRIIDPVERFERYRRAHGLERGSKEDAEVFRLPDDGHPSALAHSLWAEELYPAVLEAFGGSAAQ